MKLLLKLCGLCIFIFAGNNSFSQKYTVANAHAHNDYEHPIPFFTAYNAGFGSIEADVYPVDGVLYVAHDKENIQTRRTLKALYLEPLLSRLMIDRKKKIKLLIDIKENYAACLQILLKELEQLQPGLTSPGNKNGRVTILISGERPKPADYASYPDFIFFDDDLKLPHTAEEWQRVGQVSLSFERYSKWKGDTAIDAKDVDVLRNVVDSVHTAGKTIRFWAAPDNKASWELQTKLGVDLIGTDKITELANFLKGKKD